MPEATVVAVDPPTEMPSDFGDFNSCLQIAPLDDGFFSHHVFNGDGVARENGTDDVVALEDLDLDPSFAQVGSNYDQMHSVFISSSSELRHLSGDGMRSCDGSGLMNSASPDSESQHISGYLNMPSPESNESNCDGGVKEMNCPSPDSQGSGNFVSDSNNRVARSGNEEDGKRKARLLRNRESAQLSRQRKKNYVEELEDKVRSMHSTIQDLNSKISYIMAENATMKQQMGVGSTAPPAVVPPPGMYTHPAMMYPWMPYAQPYKVKSQGTQVPLVPIPRLKPQQPKTSKKGESKKKPKTKKNDGLKTKKVAGVSFLGLLFFIMLFRGLAPMVNVRYGGAREAFRGGESYIAGGFSENHPGRVLMVNGTGFDEKHSGRRDYSSVYHGQRGQESPGDPRADESVCLGNGTEPLAASLYVPMNNKLVKIDGNLIIHSVLASEKAMASNQNGGGETGLAVPVDLAPAIPGQDVGRNGARHPLLRALGAVDKDGMKSTATDGRLQKWFSEGLAGNFDTLHPLSLPSPGLLILIVACMCTEVFQFDVSPVSASGVIVPTSTSRNISEAESMNSTNPSKARNRRILHPIPLPESSHNISGEHTRRRSEKEDLNLNKNTSSMVVSVLFDPREVSDAEADGVMGTKSLSQIFVVVLLDSVRYVTYSCMLPFKAAPHLVTA
ncbi:hypothetical protein SASPL_129854 [Salvia splendens]|uniref:BZIP domain-containing protein n=1 Tax=Salvia splendens TaxID=180675 RepID=A0A8X8XGL1_SALSN|nr:hypothetical protein SASPL_129854 [Salvia splendens]